MPDDVFEAVHLQNECDRDVALIIAWASRHDCEHTWSQYAEEFSAACAPCVARKILGPLKCACGAFELLRWSPSMYVKPVSHTPDACAEPTRPTHCASCRQALPPECA